MPRATNVLLLLWLRLISISVITLFFVVSLRDSPARIQGWFFYLRAGEVLFEIAVRLVFLALSAGVVATLAAAALAPFLMRADSPERFAEKAVRSAVGVSAFCVFGIVLRILLESTRVVAASGRMQEAIQLSYIAVFAAALWMPRTRKRLVTSLDPFLSERAVRRTAIAIVPCVLALITLEWALGLPGVPAVEASVTASHRGPNILLITFDALSAKDMSVYGYRLPTTPHIEEFARKSTVFTSFFSAATFTTPCIASILTGKYPSEHHVYQLKGNLTKADARRTFPQVLRGGRYFTGGWFSNQFAYFLAAPLTEEFDVLPASPHVGSALMNAWNALAILHQPQPFGSRAEEFDDFKHAWDTVPDWLAARNPRRFGQTKAEFSPSASFAQARELLAGMPEGFFLWVHVLAPHAAYLADPPFLGRFLPSDEMRTAQEQVNFVWWPHYAARNQKLVDKARLRYDEFVAETDAALGGFLDELEDTGKLRDTAVILSADHGESFEYGTYSHGANQDQASPEIHIPLIIRMPGQEHGSRVAVTADETSLGPTVLDIAGLPRPDWMRGQSLVPWLNRDGEGAGEGRAFTQFFWDDNVFKPLKNGTVGVIDGRHQCVLDVATGKAKLRSLAEVPFSGLDRPIHDPALKKKLIDAIYSRFPDLPRKSE